MTTALPRHRQLGLTDDEAARIPELLGREATDPELVMFSPQDELAAMEAAMRELMLK